MLNVELYYYSFCGLSVSRTGNNSRCTSRSKKWPGYSINPNNTTLLLYIITIDFPVPHMVSSENPSRPAQTSKPDKDGSADSKEKETEEDISVVVTRRGIYNIIYSFRRDCRWNRSSQGRAWEISFFGRRQCSRCGCADVCEILLTSSNKFYLYENF